MKSRVSAPLLFCLVLLVTYSCTSPTSADDYEPIEITGQVVSSSSNNAIGNAIVRIIAPFEQTTITESDGHFSFNIAVDSTFMITITANKEGFAADTIEVLAIPERNIELPTFRLTGYGEEVEGSVDGPGSITLLSVEPDYLVVQGSGGNEDAFFTFQVRDSSGRAINAVNPVNVSFRFGSRPEGGERLHPETVQTDGQGRATVNLRSGTTAGVVQVIAEIDRDELMASLGYDDYTISPVQRKESTGKGAGLTEASYGVFGEGDDVIRSQPVSIVIHGGLPDQNHFSVAPAQLNFPGYNINGLVNEISVIVGDKFGNIVAPGTAVYFTTNGGVIEGSARTDDKGSARVELKSGNPRPSHPDYGPGFATIKAHTADDGNNRVEDETIVLFSGVPYVEISSPGGDSRTYTYRVHDQNGNPLAAETSILVNIDGDDVDVSGDTDITLGDTQGRGKGTTEFSFRVTGEGNEYLVKVEVEGPNGKASASAGRTSGGGEIGGPGSGEAASISLTSVSSESITVRESGDVENARFIFQVVDASGSPVDENAAATVNFSLGSNPGGDITLHPSTAVTDASGQVSVNLRSGTTAGVAQVIAEVEGTDIRSKPVSIVVHAGLPDQDHFAVTTETRNIPGLSTYGVTSLITAFVGDKYGNIVSPGTSVYFTTNGGFIAGSAQTDERGRATVELTATNPNPPGGFATVTAQTANENNEIIDTEVDVLFSGPPTVSINPSVINVGNLGGQSFQYSVTDQNGNPLAQGTNIVVTVETPDDDLAVIGDVDITLGDHQSSGPGTTDFRFNISDTDEEVLERDVQITIKVTGPNGEVTETITGTKQKVAH